MNLTRSGTAFGVLVFSRRRRRSPLSLRPPATFYQPFGLKGPEEEEEEEKDWHGSWKVSMIRALCIGAMNPDSSPRLNKKERKSKRKSKRKIGTVHGKLYARKHL